VEKGADNTGDGSTTIYQTGRFIWLTCKNRVRRRGVLQFFNSILIMKQLIRYAKS
jgi:hypothetical protein